MKILFIETEYKGHHLTLYAYKLLKKFSLRHDVYFLTSVQAQKSDEFKCLKGIKKKFKIVSFKSQEAIKLKSNLQFFFFHLKNFYYIYKFAKNIIKKNKIDLVYFNHLDPYIFILAIFFLFKFNIKIAGLLLNIKFHQYHFKFRKKFFLDEIKKYLFQIFIKKKIVKKVFIIDPLFINFLKDKKIFSKKIVKVNEAVNQTIVSSKIVKRKYITILIYGAISSRKNFNLLINTIFQNKLFNNFKIIIAGKFDQQSKEYFNSKIVQEMIKKETMLLKDHFINSKEESKLFNACDMIWLGYYGGSEGSSGVLQLAINNNKPVIFSNTGLINYVCLKHKLGFQINSNKNDCKKLTKLLKSSDLYNKINLKSKYMSKYKKKINKNLVFEKKIYEEIVNLSCDD